DIVLVLPMLPGWFVSGAAGGASGAGRRPASNVRTPEERKRYASACYLPRDRRTFRRPPVSIPAEDRRGQDLLLYFGRVDQVRDGDGDGIKEIIAGEMTFRY